MAVLQADKQYSPRMVILITREEDKKRLEDLFDELHIPICYQCRGKGTAPSEMMDIFGLSGTTRLITVGILSQLMVRELTQAAEKRLSFHKKGGGIVLTLPVTGLQNPIFQMLNDEARDALKQQIEERTQRDMAEVKNHMNYVVIWVSVASGYSDEVIDAARAVGAKGGTVLRGRQRNSERVSQHFGISMQEERDFVMMVVPKEKKGAIMSAVSGTCGLTSQAHGVILSLPVDQVMGLEEEQGK